MYLLNAKNFNSSLKPNTCVFRQNRSYCLYLVFPDFLILKNSTFFSVDTSSHPKFKHAHNGGPLKIILQ